VTTADLELYSMQRVASLDALCALVSERHARGEATVLLAGGTDWVVEQEMRAPLNEREKLPLVVDVSRLEDLRGVSFDRGVLRIGASTTYLELRRDPVVLSRAPMLAAMAKDLGAIQIQARGTLGGNLATASPAADGVAALAAYEERRYERCRDVVESSISIGRMQLAHRPPQELAAYLEGALSRLNEPF